MTRIRLLKKMVVAMATLCSLGACTYSPPWPDSVFDVDEYRSKRPAMERTAVPKFSVAGVKSAPGGAYIDVFVIGPTDGLVSLAGSWASAVSRFHPEKCLEIGLESGALIELRSMQEPIRIALHGISLANPPGETIDEAEGQLTWVQRVMVRTRPRLREGQRIEIRLVDKSAARQATTSPTSLPVFDAEWQEVVVGKYDG